MEIEDQISAFLGESQLTEFRSEKREPPPEAKRALASWDAHFKRYRGLHQADRQLMQLSRSYETQLRRHAFDV